MTPIQKQIQENFKMLEEMRRQLNIQPRMKVEYTGGKPQGTFDLRSLNKAIIEKCR